MIHTKVIELDGCTITLETGLLAKQAGGSATCRIGDSICLAAACISPVAVPARDFVPFSVEYRERLYAAGRIPGGFFKREGRPNEKEIITSRLIDRPVRPLLPKGLTNEVQVNTYALSSDGANDTDIPGIIASSAALAISDVPFLGPIGAVRMGLVNGIPVVNPTFAQLEETTIDIVVAGTCDAVTMIEGACKESSDDEILACVEMAFVEIKKICTAINELVALVGKPKMDINHPARDEAIWSEVEGRLGDRAEQALHIADKEERTDAIALLWDEISSIYDVTIEPEQHALAKEYFHELERQKLRNMILHEGVRTDGRKNDEIREITIQIGILPRAHGSALFTRGQTQALVAATLGTKSDEQIVEDLEGESKKTFMLHYNFPPFSVGEVRPIRGVSRREIGHGLLAERALSAVIPADTEFPYTIRIVSDILESNGSSSMATVCGASLSLMDAGVPIGKAVAGIAMGLVTEEGKVAILSDINGTEDHLGDMDLKVAGTRQGVTALQMDLKVHGIGIDLMRKAFAQAKEGRLYILNQMDEVIAAPRAELSPFAPRILIHHIHPDKIRDIIGPGGKTIRKIIEETGVTMDVEDDGSVFIASVDLDSAERALAMIKYLTEDVEVGKIYTGKVTRLMKFGAFVEILPGKEGLVHISELDTKRVDAVEDVAHEGDRMQVMVIEIDDMGRTNLSRKRALLAEAGEPYETGGLKRKTEGGERRPGGDRGGRDRGRGRR
jgi:polyribonucleotide nucleotidyltransferase